MASNQTTNYKLNQWQAEDKVLRTEFNADNLKVEEALTGLAGQVAGKAAQTALDALKTTVNGKAAQADLTALTATVNTKASQTEVNSLKTTVNGKASQTELNSLKTTVNGKAAQTALDSLSATVAKKYGSDNPVVYTGTYTGTYNGSGTVKEAIVNLGFRPSFVIVMCMKSDLGSYDYQALWGTPAAYITRTPDGFGSVSNTGLVFTNTGFTLDRHSNYESGFNLKGVLYRYYAFR